jgi:predicted  nucleic acid-binding Zn-ribbon protein
VNNNETIALKLRLDDLNKQWSTVQKKIAELDKQSSILDRDIRNIESRLLVLNTPEQTPAQVQAAKQSSGEVEPEQTYLLKELQYLTQEHHQAPKSLKQAISIFRHRLKAKLDSLPSSREKKKLLSDIRKDLVEGKIIIQKALLKVGK